MSIFKNYRVLILVLFFTTLKSYLTYAQISYQITPQDLQMCGQSKVFDIKVTNSGAAFTVPENFELDLSYLDADNLVSSKGLFFSSPSFLPTTSKVNFLNFVEYTGKLAVSISEMKEGEIIDVYLNVTAGCGVTIEKLDKLTGTAVIKNGNSVINGTDIPFVINKSSNGNLELVNDSHVDFGNVGSVITRTYILKNNQSFIFSGAVSFTDILGDALQLQNVEANYVLSDGVTKTPILLNSSDGKTFSAEVNAIKYHEYIEFRETVKVTGCLQMVGAIWTGESSLTIHWGCQLFDLCTSSHQTPIINKDDNKANIVLSPLSATNSLNCFNNSYVDRSVTYENQGSVTASNITFMFENSSIKFTGPISIPENSFVVQILKKGSSIPLVYSVNRKPENQAPVGRERDYYGYGAGYYRDYIDLMNKDFYSACHNANEQSVFRLLINSLKDNSGNILSSIDLESGDKITIKWQEKNCCMNNDSYSNKDMYTTGMTVEYYSGCLDPLAIIINNQYAASRKVYVAQQATLSYDPMVDGDPDLCKNTLDGEIKEMNIAFNSFSNWDFNDKNYSESPLNLGQLEVQLMFTDGIDLDLSLGGMAVAKGYNKNCSTNCNNCTSQWSTSDPKYSISFQYNNGNTILNWYPVVNSVQPIATQDINSPDKTVVSANKGYRIRFDLNDLYNLIVTNHLDPVYSSQPYNQLNHILLASILNFSVRGYCSEPPAAVSYFSERVSYLPPNCTGGCDVPLATVANKYIVHCPGCVTPGANITGSIMNRTSAYVGFVDDKDADGNKMDNGAPDNTTKISDLGLKRNVTNGDVLETNIAIKLSDGDNTAVKGFQREVIHGKQIYLDNLYLEVKLDNAGVKYYKEATYISQVSFDKGVNWVDIIHEPTNSQSKYYYHINSKEYGFNNYFLTDDGGNLIRDVVMLRTFYRVSKDLNETGSNVSIVNIDYKAVFSDCDNCEGWNFTGDAAVVGCKEGERGTDCSGIINNMSYFCQGGASIMKFIPFMTSNDAVMEDGICQKKLTVSTNGVLANGQIDIPYINAFSNEYRTFLDGQNISINAQIPSGYEIVKLIVKNVNYRFYGWETVLIDDKNVIANNFVNGSNLEIPVSFKSITEAIYKNYHTYDNYVNYTPGFPIGFNLFDESYSLSAEIYLEPAQCSSVTNFTGYSPGDISGLAVMPLPTLALPNLPTLDAQTKSVYARGLFFSKPQTGLTAYSKNGTDLVVNSNQLYIPIEFGNSDPVDANGNRITIPNGNGELKSKDALYPYIYFKDLAILQSYGFDVVGVYQGNFSEQNLPSGTVSNFYKGNGFAELKQGANNFIQANSKEVYTVVLKYQCPQGCSAWTVCDGNPVIPSCIKDPKLVNMLYGWRCDKYPSSVLEVNESCTSNGLQVKVNTYPAAIQGIVSINNGTTVNTCSDFNYHLDVYSCKLGSIKNVDVVVTLPTGVLYSGTSGIYIASNQVKFNLVGANDNTFKDGALKTLDIVFKNSCDRLISSQEIVTTISGDSYCNKGSIEVRTPFTVSPVDKTKLDDITILSGAFSSDKSKVIVTCNLNGVIANNNVLKIQLPAGVKVKGTVNQTLAIIPIQQGIQSYLLDIESTQLICSGIFAANVVLSREYIETCSSTNVTCSTMVDETPIPFSFTVTPFTVQLNGPSAACLAESVSLSAVVNPPGTYTYKWYDNGSLLTGQTNAILGYNFTAPTNISLEVKNENGCVNTASLVLIKKSDCCPTAKANPVAIQCPGNTFILSAVSPNPNWVYTWMGGGMTYNGATVTTAKIYENVTFTLTVTDPNNTTCAGTDEVDVVVFTTTPVSITIDDPSTSEGSDCNIMCPGQRLNLIATSGFVSYVWSGPVLPANNSTTSILVYNNPLTSYPDPVTYGTTDPNPDGYYTVSVTDGNGCKNASTVKVITNLVLVGENEICYGEVASFNVDLAGATCSPLVEILPGTVNNNPDGNQYQDWIAFVILPKCTLATNTVHLKIKPKPAVPVISPATTVLCPTDPVNVNLSVSFAGNIPPIESYSWSSGEVNVSQITAIHPGAYSVTAIANGCTSSGYAQIIVPSLSIYQSCDNSNPNIITLTASYNMAGTIFEWRDPANNILSETGNTITVTSGNGGLYTVNLNHSVCGVITASTFIQFSQGTSELNINKVMNGAFEDYSCVSNVPGSVNKFSSDLVCIDQPFAQRNQMMGHYTVTNQASGWNFGMWNGTGFGLVPTDNRNFLLIDGSVTTKNERVWYQTVHVTKGVRYYFKTLVNNIINKEGQIPEVSLLIGNNPGVKIGSQTIYSNQARWVELSGEWVSDVTAEIEIGIVLKAGGVLGRDIGIDNITFQEIICRPASDGRICLAKVNVGLDKYICPGATATVGANTATGVKYAWTLNGKLVSEELNPTFNPTTTSVYRLTVTDVSNNCTAIDDVTVNVGYFGIPFTATATASPETICNGGTTQLNVTTSKGNGSFKYLWTPTASLNSSTIPNPVASPSKTTDYSVVIQDGENCISLPASVKVTVNQKPAVIAGLDGLNSLCVNSANTTYDIPTPDTGVNYFWNISPMNSGSLLNSTGTSTIVDWNHNYVGAVDIVTTGANSCGSTISVAKVTIASSKPAKPIVQGPLTPCKGTVESSYAISPVAGVQYNWLLTGGGVLTNNGNEATVKWTPGFVGMTQIFVTAQNGCGTSGLSTNKVKVIDEIGVVQVPNGLSSICTVSTPNSIYTIAKPTNSNTVNWVVYPSDAGIANGTGTTTKVTWNKSYSGQAQVVATASNECDSKSSSLAVSLSNKIITSYPTIVGPVCRNRFGGSGVYNVNLIPGAATYQWQISPSSAGKVIGTTNQVTIIWNPGNNIPVQISARAVNDCGPGPWSVGKLVRVGTCKEGELEEEMSLSEFNVELYPNPSMDESNLYISGTESEFVRLEIYNLDGVKVQSYENVPVRQEVKVARNLRSGVYMFRIIDQAEVKVIKFVKTE